jgi:nicotinamidase-related amidase
MSGQARALVMLDLTRQTTRPDGLFGQLVDPAASLARVAAASRAALRTAREAGDPVVWVLPGADFVQRVSGRELTDYDQGPDEELVGAPASGEPVIAKDGISGFAGGALEQTLRSLGVHTVALLGIATQYVIKATAQDALTLGFEVVVLEDCCTDVNPEIHEATLEELKGTCAVGPAATLLAPA